MLREFLARRLTLFFFMLLLLSAFTFSLAYLLPGEAVSNLSGVQSPNSFERDALMQKYALDQSYISQYFKFISHIFNGDWGTSFSSGQPVFEHIKELFPATFELAFYALIVSIIIGVPAGILSAAYHKKLPDYGVNSLALIGISTPIFWLALVLIMVFCLHLGWLPMSGRIGLLYEIPDGTGFILIDILISEIDYKQQALLDAVKHLTLPTLVLATYPTSVLTRFTKDSTLTVLDKPYIKTARAKGLTRYEIITRHALKNALLPIIKQIGLQFSTLITLAMLTEVIFSWPGVGQWLINSIYQRDYPAISGGLLTVSLFVIIANIAADILHNLLDPVSRNQSHGQV